MPKVKLGEPPRDKLIELIFGRQHSMGMTNIELAKALKMSLSQVTRLRGLPSREWKISEVERVCRALGIPKEEWRNVI